MVGKGKRGEKEVRGGVERGWGGQTTEAFLIKELVTVTFLVEMPGLIWAC